MIHKPSQLIHSSKKDKDWYEENGKYYLNCISFIDSKKYEKRIDKACGNIKEADYNYITNPYGDLIGRDKELPAKLTNKDIISPIANQIMGEWLRRNIDPIVYNKNSDLNTAKMQMRHKLTVEKVQQEFVNMLVTLGAFVPGQVDKQGQPIEPPLSKEAIDEAVTNMVDEHSINGQYKLDYVYQTEGIKQKLKAIFYFYFTSGLGLAYRDIIDDNIVYKYIKPKDFGYVAGEDVQYIQDSEAVKCQYKVQYSDILTLFDGIDGLEEIKNELKNEVDSMSPSTSFSYQAMFNKNFYGVDSKAGVNDGELKKGECTLTHIQWKSLTTIYRKHIIDEFGVATHIDLDDRYEPMEEDDIEKRVCTERHEIWCINNKYFLGGQVLPFGNGDFSNPNKGTFSYNGVTVKHYLDNPNTIIDALDPYQEAYNICDYLMQKALNKNKGKIATIPLSILNGFKENKVETIMDAEGKVERIEVQTNKSAMAEGMYFADATQFLFIDDAELTQQQLNLVPQLLKVLDLSNANEIEYYYNYKDRIKEDAYEHVGFNRGRRGAATERDAVHNTKEAQYVGSLLTEELFEDFRLFTELEFEAILNLTNYLYKDGLKAQFFNSDYELQQIDVPPAGLSNANFGIMVKSGGRERENFEMMRQNIQAMSQNGYTPSMMATLMSKSSNFDKLAKELKKIEQQQQQQQGAAQEAINQIEREKLQLEKDKLALERIKVLGELELKAQQIGGQLQQGGINPLDTIKIMNDNTKAQHDSMFKLADIKLKQADIETKKYVSDNQVAIAKENKGQ